MPAYAHRMDGITGSAIRELFKLLSKGDIISLAAAILLLQAFLLSR